MLFTDRPNNYFEFNHPLAITKINYKDSFSTELQLFMLFSYNAGAYYYYNDYCE